MSRKQDAEGSGMTELLQFIFSSFLVWLGAFVLVWLIFEGITSVISAIRGEEE
jgi:hypothetical protein